MSDNCTVRAVSIWMEYDIICKMHVSKLLQITCICSVTGTTRVQRATVTRTNSNMNTIRTNGQVTLHHSYHRYIRSFFQLLSIQPKYCYFFYSREHVLPLHSILYRSICSLLHTFYFSMLAVFYMLSLKLLPGIW